MLTLVADELIEEARDRARLPTAALSASKLIQIANSEMKTYLAPLITSVRESYYEANAYYSMSPFQVVDGALLDLILDAPLFTQVPYEGPQTLYRVPSRAQGGALRAVAFLDAAGQTFNVPRISVDDQERATWGFILQDHFITYVNRINRTDPVALKMTFAVTPGLLCAAADARVVTDIAGRAVTLGALGAPDHPISGSIHTPDITASTAWDFVKPTPGFETVGMNRTGSYAGGVITLDNDLPRALAIGDYVAPAGYSPVPQCPDALWFLLAQSMAAVALRRAGQSEEADRALAERKVMETQVKPLLQNRVQSAPKAVMARTGLLSSARRW